MTLAETQSTVLDWYATNGRDLAFRRTTDPWAILVSEVMAQQTQAVRAAEAWTRFIEQFPTPTSLAAASPATVIRAWRGLGYNRRAIALRAAAVAIAQEHGGEVPEDLEALERLPGIGPYTARAVLALAFGRPVAALDVNIRRVLTRAFVPASLPPRELQVTADALVPLGDAAGWTHALMDIGAAFCRLRNPRCASCPLQNTCTYANGASEAQPLADTAGPPSRRPRQIQFESTTRWLRGRIVDRLRDAPNETWVRFAGPIGSHDGKDVERALATLALDGVIELDPTSAGRAARLSTAP